MELALADEFVWAAMDAFCCVPPKDDVNDEDDTGTNGRLATFALDEKAGGSLWLTVSARETGGT